MAQSNPFDQFDAPVAPGALPPGAIVLGGSDPTLPTRRELDLIQERQQIAAAEREAAAAPIERAAAAADLRKALADAEKAERDLARPTGTQADERDRLSRLNQLVAQISRVQQLYDTSIGTTKGLAGLQDYLPTDANARFDAAGAALSQQGLAAFRVPGTGTVSDRDAIMFDRANLPTAATRDAAIEEQLLGLKTRVSEEMRALGQPVPFSDRTERAMVEPGMGRMQLTSGPSVSEVDPARRGAAARMNQLLRSGASDEEISRYGASVNASPESVNAALAFRRANPNYRGSYDTSALELRQRDLSTGERLLNSAAQSPVGAYAVSAADAITLGGLDEFSANPELTRARMQGLREMNPGSSLLGTVTGGAMAAGGLEAGAARMGLGRAAPVVGDLLFGAGYGAGSAEPGNRLSGAALGASSGVFGGMFGRGAARAGGRALTGVRNAAVDELQSRGIPLTLGQAVSGSGRLGQLAKGVEDRLAGFPGVGDAVNARRLDGLRAFNRAAMDDALAPIGEGSMGVIGEEGIDRASGLVSQGYRRALDGVNVPIDARLTAELGQLRAAGGAIPRTGPEFEHVVAENIDPHLTTGNVLGPQVQDMLQTVRGTDFGSDAMGTSANNALGHVGDTVRSWVDRQAPGVIPALREADQAYRLTGITRDAVNAARNGSVSGEGGLFTAAQLSNAAAANAKRFGGSQGTTRQPFFDLTSAARDILPNRVPDSGTAGRLVTTMLPGAVAGGAGVGAMSGDAQTGAGTGLLTALALMAGGSRSGQRALVSAVTRRPDAVRRAGEALTRRARIGGMFGAPVGYQMLAPVLFQDGY